MRKRDRERNRHKKGKKKTYVIVECEKTRETDIKRGRKRLKYITAESVRETYRQTDTIIRIDFYINEKKI